MLGLETVPKEQEDAFVFHFIEQKQCLCAVAMVFRAVTEVLLFTSSSLCDIPRSYDAESTFTFMHLADAFIQSDLQCIQAIRIVSMCSLGIEPTTFCTANTML